MGNESNDDLVMGLVEGALALPSAERVPWLRTECGADTDLFDEVIDLVRWEEKLGGFLAEPVVPRLPSVGELFANGSVINERFRIVDVLGSGSTCIVYEAIDKQADSRVALRRARSGHLPPTPAPDSNHSRICRIQGRHMVDTADGPIEVSVSDYIPGTTLESRIRKRRLSSAESESIAEDLGAAIAHLLRHGFETGGISLRKIMVHPDRQNKPHATLLDPIGLRLDTPGEYRLPPPLDAMVASRLSRRPWKSRLAPVIAISTLLALGAILPEKPFQQHKPVRLAMLVSDQIDEPAYSNIRRVEERLALGSGAVTVIPSALLRERRVTTVERAFSVLGATHVLSTNVRNGVATIMLLEIRHGSPQGEWSGDPAALADGICQVLKAPFGSEGCAPNVPAALELEAARLADSRGSASVALAHRTRAVRLTPGNADRWRELALAYSAAKHPDAATAAWLGAVAAQPDYFPSYFELGDFCLAQGRYSQAEQLFRHMTEVAPESQDAWKGLGIALGRLGREEESSLVLRKAAALNSSAN